MIRLGRRLILNKLDNADVERTLKYYSISISDGVEHDELDINYVFNNDCDINIPRYIYVLEDGSIHTYKLDSLMYDEEYSIDKGSAQVYYTKAGVYYKGKLEEKENLFKKFLL